MKLQSLLLPAVALGTAAAMIIPAGPTDAYMIIHSGLNTGQRDFRIWNNFAQTQANDNNSPHPNFPGATGAVMAIWKGHVEWQSTLHGNGGGDPSQNTDLGSGGANFDPYYLGAHDSAGGLDENIVSVISSCSPGTLAYTESPGPSGWRIRFCESVPWADGPGGSIGSRFDIQGVACNQYGHALGLGNSTDPNATMFPTTDPGSISWRSINVDDQNGIRAIYGAADFDAKPRITDVCIEGDQITIQGTHFTPTNNQIWFTSNTTGNGQPVKVTGLPSPSGTSLTATVPALAGPGDVLVRISAAGNASLSSAFPTDLQTSSSGCFPPCNDPAPYCTGLPNSVGAGMNMATAGSTSVTAEDLALIAVGGPPGQAGIFYYGENQDSVPFGEGLRCVAPGMVGTFRLPVVQIDGFGDATYALDWSAAPVGAGDGQIVAGATWNFQFWYRDPAGGPAGFNLSNGMSIGFCQ